MVQTRLHKHSLSKKEQAVSGVASRASVRDPIDEFQDVYGSRAASAAFRQQLGSDFSRSGQIQPVIQAKPSFRGLSQELAPIQAKLTVGPANDRYEQEADRVARQVVQRIHAPVSNSSTQGSSVQRRQEQDELQKKAIAPIQGKEMSEGGEISTSLESEINRARGGGQALAPELRAKMGEAMGADFSGVRVHTDGRADGLNRAVGARAFTTGQDLFFKRGEYQLGSRGGQELIAHELTHVVQQNRGAMQRSQLQRDFVEEKDQFVDDAIYKRKYKRTGPTIIFLTDENGNLKLDGVTPKTKKLKKKLKKENKLQIVRRKKDPDGLPEGEYYLVKFIEVDVNQQKADTLDVNCVYGYTKPDTVKALGEYKDISTIGTSDTNPKQGKIIPQTAHDPDISQTDVFQNAISDCYLHAALISIAEVNPAAITRLFTRIGDTDLDITFPGFNEPTHRRPPLKVTVQKKLFISPDGSLLYGGKKDSYLWPAFIQKAWAISKGKYADLPMGQPMEIMSMITGENPKQIQIFSPKGNPVADEAWRLYSFIVLSLQNLRPLVAVTKTWTDKTTSKGLFKSDGYKMPEKSEHGGIGILHCYSILGINNNAQIRPQDNPDGLPNGIVVTLRDPRTPDKLLQTPLEDLLDKRKFSYVTGN